MLKIQEHSKNILRLRKGEELLFWMLDKIIEIKFISQLMFISTTSPLVLCMYKFVLNIFYSFVYYNNNNNNNYYYYYYYYHHHHHHHYCYHYYYYILLNYYYFIRKQCK